jgi:hypothetical protein
MKIALIVGTTTFAEQPRDPLGETVVSGISQEAL